MSSWESQNDALWKRLAFVMTGNRGSGLIWITCDNARHREKLFEAFKESFSRFQHVRINAREYPEGSIAAYWRHLWEEAGGGSEAEKLQACHVIGLEAHVAIQGLEGNDDFFKAMNWERSKFFNMPFLVVVWSDSHVLRELRRIALDFSSWLADWFAFEGPEEMLESWELEAPTSFYTYHQLSEAEREKLHNRNARLLGMLNQTDEARDRVELLKNLAYNHERLAEYEMAIQFLREAFELSKEDMRRDIMRHLIVCLGRHGAFNMQTGRVEESRSHLMEAISLAEKHDFQIEHAQSLQELGELELALGNNESARSLFMRGIEYFASNNLYHELANSLFSLSKLEVEHGNLVVAQELLEEAMIIFKEEKDSLGLGNTLLFLGDIKRRTGNPLSAREYYEQAISEYQKIQDHLGIANSNLMLGMLAGGANQAEMSIQHLLKAAEGFVLRDNPAGLANALVLLALYKHLSGDFASRDDIYSQAKEAASESGSPAIIDHVANIGAKWNAPLTSS